MKSKEVLKLLNMSRAALTYCVQDGRIKVKLLPNGRYEYDEKSVLEFYEKNKNKISRRVQRKQVNKSTTKEKNVESNNNSKVIKKLANEHWNWLNGLLDSIGDIDDKKLIEYVYKTAFIHGAKHAFELMEDTKDRK